MAIIDRLAGFQAGVTKVACVAVGSGAELLTPLAVDGAVDAWAVVHGRASRKLAARGKSPGIIQVTPRSLSVLVLLCVAALCVGRGN